MRIMNGSISVTLQNQNHIDKIGKSDQRLIKSNLKNAVFVIVWRLRSFAVNFYEW